MLITSAIIASVIASLIFFLDFAHGHGLYDEETNKQATGERTKRQTAVVGSSCIENTDCRRGAYCDSTRRCACLTTYTEISGYCWQKINPGQAGCTYNKQCSAVWPNAYCNGGTCRCGNNAPPFQTNDGPVCVNYGFCPINGENTKLKDQAGRAFECKFGNRNCPSGYDCICATQNCTTDATGSESSVTFCCPKRALACIMPLDAGTTPVGGGGAVSRYYHNSVTGNCESFPYRGNGGNANNFETLDQCESYCKQLCLRGSPQYSPGSFPDRHQPIKYCTTVSSNACGPNHYCYERGTNTICCPTSAFICSQNGGLDSAASGAFDQGIQGDSTVTFSRYYYDSTRRQCLPFTYFGQGGNYNNFLSEEQCSRFCALTVCQAGEPLRDRSGLTNIQCSGSAVCPASHECKNQVCCPTKQTVCSQPKAVGTCGNYVEKWWYNAQTRNCELFTFSGCQGNANNFDTYRNCQDFCQDANVQPMCVQGRALKDSYGNYIVCGGTSQLRQTCPANYLCYFDGSNYGCCPTQAYTCQLNFDQGSVCGPTSSRWYYNSAQRRCESFTYNGCDGNSNNFATQTDCRDYCGAGGYCSAKVKCLRAGCAEGGEPFRESSGRYRVCTAGVSCPSTHYCTQVSLGTGTAVSTTYNYCCPTRTYVCSLPRDQGVRCGSSTLTRYYFNVVTKNCETMNFNGCEGNRNNFATRAQCLNYCNSAGCPAGQVALRDSANNQLATCTPGVVSSCGASGYTCIHSSLLGQNICCGSTVSADTCPAGQNAYISPFTNSALQCQPNVAGSCPSGFSCWYAVTQNQYFCCGSAPVQCPRGGSPYIDQGNNQARQCTPGVVGACPSGYTCQATTITIGSVTSTTGYCCGTSNFCGSGYEAYFQNNQPVSCNLNAPNVCPQPYTCRMTSVGTGEYYCCKPKPKPPVHVCGLGRRPYMLNNAPVVCTTGSTSTNCPRPYQCLLYSHTNTFYCCHPGGGITPSPPGGRCPPGYNPLMQNGRYTYCSPTANTCPANSYCQFDSLQRRYICCGKGVVLPPGNYCPANLKVYVNPTTNQPQFCTPGISSCPTRYQCSPSALGGSYCCGAGGATGNSGCSGGRAAYIPPGSTTPTQCFPGALNSCPTGYRCEFSTVFSRYQCCQSAGITPGGGDPYGCPVGRSYLYRGTQTPLSCQPGGFRCPAGYTCRPSTRSPGRYQCCSGFRSQAEGKDQKQNIGKGQRQNSVKKHKQHNSLCSADSISNDGNCVQDEPSTCKFLYCIQG